MAHPQRGTPTVDVYLNDDRIPILMAIYQLIGLQQAWEKQGRYVEVLAHHEARPAFRYRRPKLRVIVEPPPDRPLHEEITALL